MPLLDSAGLSQLPPLPEQVLHRTEVALREAVVAALGAQGLTIADRVVCATGEPDIITADYHLIVEIKHRLYRKPLHHAIGQLLLYRQCLNPQARIAIIGYPTQDVYTLASYITALGVDLWYWDDGDVGVGEWGMGVGEGTQAAVRPTPALPAAPPQPLTPSPHSLLWNVAALARARGFKNVPALGFALGLSRQGLYALWDGTAQRISLDLLGRLAHVLHASPGDWFRVGNGGWGLGVGEPNGSFQSPSPNSQPLRWNVRAQAEAAGFNAVQFGFKTHLHSHTVEAIWNDTAQGVSRATLAKIARVLGEVHPFDIGDLFVWDTPDPSVRPGDDQRQ